MAGFANALLLADAQNAGKYLYASFRKAPTQTTASGIWFDLSMSPGNPAPNYFIGSPNVFTPMRQSTDGGLRHGGAVAASGAKKFLRKIMALTPTAAAAPCAMKLLDYLGFYGFIDESVTDLQPLDNTLGLTRYTTGAGVQLMPIVVAGQTGGQDFYVIYTNQDGVAGRISQTVRMTTQAVNGTVLISVAGATLGGNNGPFIPLQQGDTGVRLVESVQILGVGDVGLFALVLVKPLATFMLAGIDAACEVDYLTDMAALPEILDDAYLNFIALPVGTLAGATFAGIIETTWG
jgi:hypothetical protein